MSICRTKSGKQRLNYDVEFMSDSEYRKIIKKFFLPHCFDASKSPMEVIISAFATIYEHATAWVWIEKENGIELEVAVHDDFPSIYFDLSEALDHICHIDEQKNDQAIKNINELITCLVSLRDRVEKGEFNT